MKQTKIPTPGPWIAQQPNGLHVFDRNTHVIKQVRNDGEESRWDIAEVTYARDARLISASPDLLEALKVAKRLIEDAKHSKSIVSEMAQIRAAISKATGGE